MQTCAHTAAGVRPAGDPSWVSYVSHEFVIHRPKVLCFGDSLTERGFGERGWVAGLAHHFIRRADVLNSGLGGYNTRWAMQILPDVLAGHSAKTTLLATLWFGANDAARPSGPSKQQHVPVTEYTQNLEALVKGMRAQGIQNIILITPPAVHDEGRKAWQAVRHGQEAAASMEIDRTLEYAQQYAHACVAVGKRLDVPVLELFDSMQQEKDWQERFLVDGLHFTPEGNQYVLSRLLGTLEQALPHLRPDALPIHFPPWDAVDAADPAATFKACEQLRKKGPNATAPLPKSKQ